VAQPGTETIVIREMPGEPEFYRGAALTQLERACRLLASLNPEHARLPTALPFWSVSDVVGHMFVLGGFFTSSTWAIRTGVASSSAGALAMRALQAGRSIVLPALHYSNIAAPKVGSATLPFKLSLSYTRECLELAARQIRVMPASRFHKGFPFFRWQISTPLYLAVVAKECAVHRWEIESAQAPATLDDDLAPILPKLLWASTDVGTRLANGSPNGVVEVLTSSGSLRWRLQGLGVLTEIDEPGEPNVTLSGSDADFVLTALGRVPASRLDVSGDEPLARAFLSAFSYRAGPMPFFNP
jgi:uncharacterized protein (TIGR03083 family)